MDIEALEEGQLLTDQLFLVAEARLQVDRRGQNYYSLLLNAPGGRQIEGKIWSDCLDAAVHAGDGLEVLARIVTFQGRKQLNIQRYKVLPAGSFDPAPFVRTTEIDVDAAFEELFDWSEKRFSDPLLTALVRAFHDNASFAAQFKTSPAASFHHHNYQGGLIEHTLDVWRLAEGILSTHGERLDGQLLLCGAVLHDVGKVHTYRLVAGVSERTEVGELLDHVFISASMVSNVWDAHVKPNVPADQAEAAARRKALLLHMILSHHGKLEWGSPVLPRTPEAVVLHACDALSSSLYTCFDAIEKAPEGELWTDLVNIMDSRRRIYVPPAADRTSEEDAGR